MLQFFPLLFFFFSVLFASVCSLSFFFNWDFSKFLLARSPSATFFLSLAASWIVYLGSKSCHERHVWLKAPNRIMLYSHNHDQQYKHIIHIHIHLHMHAEHNESMKTSDTVLRKIYISLYLKGLCVRGSWRLNRTATYWPSLYWS